MAIARLPIVDGDDGTWGNVLNDFLQVAHNADGTLQAGSVSNTQLDTPTQTTLAKAGSSVQSINTKTPDGSGAVTLAAADVGAVPKSTVTTKGDLLAATGSGAVSRFGVGVDHAVMLADSTQTSGLRWSTSQEVVAEALGWIIVTDPGYGADATGVADSTTAINNALTAAGNLATLSALGATVYAPTGQYKLTAALNVPTGVTFLGGGSNATVLNQTSTTANTIRGSNARNITIKDMSILGPASGTGNGIYLSSTGTYATFDCVLSGMFIKGFPGGAGIVTEDLCTSQISHVRIETCLEGFHIGENGTSGFGGTSVLMTSCYAVACTNRGYFIDKVQYSNFISCATDSCGVGYWISTCTSLAFNGCGAETTVDTSTTYPGHGFYINNGSTSISLNSCQALNINAAGVGYAVVANGGNGCSRIIINTCAVQGLASVPLYSAQVDSTSQASFINFQKHPSAGFNGTGQGNSLFISQEDLGLTAYGQVPVSGDDPFDVWGSSNTALGFGTAVQADVNKRFQIRVDGKHTWGTGSTATDTNLYRTGVGTLTTDGSLQVAGGVLDGNGRDEIAGTVAADHGLKAWNYDPVAALNSSTLVSGTLYLVKVTLRHSTLVSEIVVMCTTGATTLTTNENFVAIFDSTGVRKAVTPDMSGGSFMGAGANPQTYPLGPVTLAAGDYWIGILCNASVPITLSRSAGIGDLINMNLPAATYRFASNGTGRTTMPSSITPSSNTESALSFWMALK